jgi:hypothetical protein
MNRRPRLGIVAMTLAGLVGFLSVSVARAEHSCSFRSVSGNWGYRLAGSVIGDVTAPNYPNDGPWAGVGRLTFDRHGNVTGTGILNRGGDVLNLTFSGTYSVDTDCTGSMSIDVIGSGEDFGIFGYSMVFVDDSKEVHMADAEPGFVTNVDGKKISSGD